MAFTCRSNSIKSACSTNAGLRERDITKRSGLRGSRTLIWPKASTTLSLARMRLAATKRRNSTRSASSGKLPVASCDNAAGSRNASPALPASAMVVRESALLAGGTSCFPPVSIPLSVKPPDRFGRSVQNIEPPFTTGVPSARVGILPPPSTNSPFTPAARARWPLKLMVSPTAKVSVAYPIRFRCTAAAPP